MKIGDGWFDRAEKEYNIYVKTHMQERAALWYGNALPALAGLVKLRIDTRLKTLPNVSVNTASATKSEAENSSPTGPAAGGTSISNTEFAALSDKLNKLANWKIEKGEWRQNADGILGSGDSMIFFNSKLPPAFTLEFTMNVKNGMRPRVHFSGLFFGNEGYDKILYAYGAQDLEGSQFPYVNNQVLRVKAVFNNPQFEFFVNEQQVVKGKRDGSAMTDLKLSGGDWWSKGAVLYSNFKLRPLGTENNAGAPAKPDQPAPPIAAADPATPTPRTRPPSNTLTPQEAKAQADFKKEYANPDRDVRKAALSLLANTYHISSWQLLANVATSDINPAVRATAIATLAEEPAHNSTAARIIAQCFASTKPTDPDLRLRFAKAMVRLEFKHDILAVLVEHISKQRYPDLNAGTGYQGQTQLFNPEVNRKARENFDALLEAFNVIAKSDIKASYEAPRKVKEWWDSAERDFIKADQELTEKYKKEDAATK